MKKQMKTIDIILGDLMTYIHPEFFIDEYREKIIHGDSFNLKRSKHYYQIITTINWFFEKTKRYKIYFAEFYSNSNEVKYGEALEHHIHAYLEDVETLRNKLNTYIGCLKNDLKKIAIDTSEVINALIWLKEQIDKTFKQVSDLRGGHRHSGYRFVDGDLVDVDFCEKALDHKILKGMLTLDGLKQIKEKKEKLFVKAKSFWIKTAKNNDLQLEGVVESVLEKTNEFLYICLDIKSLFFKKVNK